MTPLPVPTQPESDPNPGHLKPVMLKPVGQMSILGEFEVPGVVSGLLARTPILHIKTRGLGPLLGNPSDRKMAHADDPFLL